MQNTKISLEQAALNTVIRLGFEYAGGIEWREPPSENWLPISSAPRSQRVLVTTEGYREVVTIARQVHQGNNVWKWITDCGESADTDYFQEGEPTHWMRLPVSPLRKKL